jgi:hypothetical protein
MVFHTLLLCFLPIYLLGCANNSTTITPTLDPTETTTPTSLPIATNTPYPYAFDNDKFNNFPESYEYLTSHLDEFVQAPDFLGDPQTFDLWWHYILLPNLGDVFERTPNVTMGSFGLSDGDFQYVPRNAGFTQNVISEPPIFYFIHDGIVYPVLVFHLQILNELVDGFMGTYAIILHEKTWIPTDVGFDAIQYIHEGSMIAALVGQFDFGVATEDTEINREFINNELNWSDYVDENGYGWDRGSNRTAIGLGEVRTWDGTPYQ